MVWIYKSITCSEKTWIILIVTLCEGKQRGGGKAIFLWCLFSLTFEMVV